MDYTAAADKFERESDILLDVLEALGNDHVTRQQLEVAVSVAKRVRSQSTFLVRELAQQRDQLQP